VKWGKSERVAGGGAKLMGTQAECGWYDIFPERDFRKANIVSQESPNDRRVLLTIELEVPLRSRNS